MFGRIFFVSHQNYSVTFIIKILQNFHDLQAGFGIQISRGFVGKNHRRIINQRAGDGHALFFTAGELVGVIIQTMLQPHRHQRLLGFMFPRRGRIFTIKQRQHNVFQNGGARQKIKGLKNKTHGRTAFFGQLVIGKMADVFTVKKIFARSKFVQKT